MAFQESRAQSRWSVFRWFGFGLLSGVTLTVLPITVMTITEWRHERAESAKWNEVEVVVASVDLPAETVLTESSLSRRRIPSTFLTDTTVASESVESLIGHRLMVTVAAGQPLQWGFLAGPTTCPLAASACVHDPVKDRQPETNAADAGTTEEEGRAEKP